MTNYILDLFLTGVSAVLTIVVKKMVDRFKQEVDEQKVMKEGMIAILHDRLFQACSFYLRQGYIYSEQLDNVNLIYKAYHELGGNGTGSEIYNRTKDLRIEIRKENVL